MINLASGRGYVARKLVPLKLLQRFISSGHYSGEVLFNPPIRWSIILLLIAIIITAGIYNITNVVIEYCAKRQIGYYDEMKIREPIEHGDYHSEDTNEFKGYGAYVAWKVFEKLDAKHHGIKPFARLVEGVELIKGIWHDTVVNAGTNPNNNCSAKYFLEYGADNPDLIAQILGVKPSKYLFLSFLGIRDIQKNCPVGGYVELDNKDSVIPVVSSCLQDGMGTNVDNSDKRALRSGVLYDIAFRYPGPEAILIRAECKKLRDAFDGLSSRVLKEMNQVREEVAGRRWILAALNGWIQFVILVLGFWGGFRLIARIIIRRRWRKKEAEEATHAILAVHSSLGDANSAMHDALDLASRRLDIWILGTVPLFGFLGTVYGMIEAMDQVGNIVAARPGVELDAAMSGITSSLSLAFFTTLLGIIVAIPLSLFQELCFGKEKVVIDEALSRTAARVAKAKEKSDIVEADAAKTVGEEIS